jgi:hypothetical protein
MTDKTRVSDLEYLQKVIENPMTPSGERKQAEEAIRKICNETGLVRSMRERLIKEMRMGRTANIRDISEYTHLARNAEKYQTI